jgi:ferredoxin
MASFSKENEMYPILKKWLLKSKKCLDAFHAEEKQFRFNPAGKGYIPDLVGCYLSETKHIQFIGMEAKNEFRDEQGIFDQAVANLVFCHQSFLAIPKKEYDKSDTILQKRIGDRAMMNRIGLLLVLRKEVIEKIPAPLQDFSLKWYDEAKSLFDITKLLGREITYWAVTDVCTGCGTCADVCPVNPTLFLVGEKAVFISGRSDECTMCYACVDSCPEGAIEEV